jgi:nitrite reductase (cytochrome c-552)
MKKEHENKDKFLKEVVPQWLKEAKANGRLANI